MNSAVDSESKALAACRLSKAAVVQRAPAIPMSMMDGMSPVTGVRTHLFPLMIICVLVGMVMLLNVAEFTFLRPPEQRQQQQQQTTNNTRNPAAAEMENANLRAAELEAAKALVADWETRYHNLEKELEKARDGTNSNHDQTKYTNDGIGSDKKTITTTAADDNNECPLAFGIGHQKSGTSSVVMALGSISGLKPRSDISKMWLEAPMSDKQLLQVIRRDRQGDIQKEGHALAYADQLARVCPKMRFYDVRRDMLTVVRSVADRLGLNAQSKCTNDTSIPRGGWRPLFERSNDTSCLVRLAEHYLYYDNGVHDFASRQTLPVVTITYEDYLQDPAGNILRLCRELQVLGPCNATAMGNVDTKQYQGVGKNRNKAFSDIWPQDVIERLQTIADKQKWQKADNS